MLQALEHGDMHVETLAYMFHNFPQGIKARPSSSGCALLWA